MFDRKSIIKLIGLIVFGLATLTFIIIILVDVYTPDPFGYLGYIVKGDAKDSDSEILYTVCDDNILSLTVKENVPPGTDECDEAIKDLIYNGITMIILSEEAYLKDSMDIIKSNPDICFYVPGHKSAANNLTAFYPRMYEGRYLSGIIAGMKTKTNSIGYTAKEESDEVIRGINAFAMGVKSVNPDANVYVQYTGSDENSHIENTVNSLIDNNKADVITYHFEHNHTAAITADKRGVYSIGYYEEVTGLSEKCLTSVVLDKNELYNAVVFEYNKNRVNLRDLNWYHFDNEIIYLSEYSSEMDENIKSRVRDNITMIMDGKNIFSGEIYDNEGSKRCTEDDAISEKALLNYMFWYFENVEVV